jgi:hypothetical protein
MRNEKTSRAQKLVYIKRYLNGDKISKITESIKNETKTEILSNSDIGHQLRK